MVDSAARIAGRLVELGWHVALVDRRASEAIAMRLAQVGLASSITHRPGERYWRLNLCAVGRAVRAELLQRQDVKREMANG